MWAGRSARVGATRLAVTGSQRRLYLTHIPRCRAARPSSPCCRSRAIEDVADAAPTKVPALVRACEATQCRSKLTCPGRKFLKISLMRPAARQAGAIVALDVLCGLAGGRFCVQPADGIGGSIARNKWSDSRAVRHPERTVSIARCRSAISERHMVPMVSRHSSPANASETHDDKCMHDCRLSMLKAKNAPCLAEHQPW